MSKVKIIECPRDAMQGIKEFIPTDLKVKYINTLLDCGFDTIDFGSFVSPTSIPQMRDTAEVLKQLNTNNSTKLLAIIANQRGASDAAQFEEINYLGYPFSISQEFQKRNTNATMEESMLRLEEIQTICVKNSKQLVVYLSMGFGNPYGEDWNPEIVYAYSEMLYSKFGVTIQALSDTIGCAKTEDVENLFSSLIPALPNVEFGAHLHTRKENAASLIASAFASGCRRYDSAINGYGGCPMASDTLTGNMPTEIVLNWLQKNNSDTGIHENAFQKAQELASLVFPIH
jgi:hydroxymethylglutaryl-CoA lyase